MREFLYYHSDPTLSEETVDFVCGFHPDDPARKCFFAVKSGGEKVVRISLFEMQTKVLKPFTFDDVSENLLEKVILPKVEAEKEKENEAKIDESNKE